MAAKTDKKRKTENDYNEALTFLEDIVRRALESIRDERVGRKELGNRLGLTDDMIRNFARGRRKVRVADLILLSWGMGTPPEWTLQEIQRRFSVEISNWRAKNDY